MKYTKSLQEFITEFAEADVTQLRLKKIEAEFDVAWAILQIEARKKIRTKLPLWASNPIIEFPSTLSTEQCSSELTARYKQSLILSGDLADLTGGLGVDSFYFSQRATQVTYVERFPEYCRVAEQNFKNLQASNIDVVCDVCEQFLSRNTHVFQTIYLDPARRGTENKRLFSLADCEPNVVKLFPRLMQCCNRLVIKVSPMVDISAAVALLPQISEVHVVSVKNECKEVLLIVDRSNNTPLTVHCVNIENHEQTSIYSFEPAQERSLPYSTYCEKPGRYLYESNSSILKAGAYKSVAKSYGVDKLHINSHLYTSDSYLFDFPGRKFEIVETIPFNGREIKEVGQRYAKINLSTRNFPLTANELQKKLKVKDGGDFYLFATTLSGNYKVLIICKKAINA